MKKLPSFWLIVGGLLIAQTAAAQDAVVHAGWLVTDADAQPRAEQSIVIEAGRIKKIVDGYIAGENVHDLSCCYVMPGFIDLHSHLTLEVNDTSDNLDATLATIIAMRMSRPSKNLIAAIPRARQMLLQGFTTVRNLGDPASVSYDLRDAINAGDIPGPRMFAVEPQFNVSGGDYDPAMLALRPDAEALIETRGLCNSPEECRSKVRSEIRRGADVIKLRFGSLARMDPKISMIEQADEIKAIIDTAHQLNRSVAAHVSGPDSIDLAVRLGVDSIEHGPLSPANIKLMAKRKVTYVPTIAPVLMNAELIKRLTGRDALAMTNQVVLAAYKAGVPIGFGSDQGALPVSEVPNEFALLHEAGLPVNEVLRAATQTAAETLKQSAHLGTISVGKYADFVASPLNPLSDIRAYTTIEAVVKEGRLF